MTRIGIYPGTFDPVTNGHRDIIKRALALVDTLVIAIAADIPKTPIFTLDERVEMVREDIKISEGIEENRVKVTSFQGLLVDFAREQKATVIIRGLRAISDFEYEFQMACMNSRLSPKIDTIFLPASEHTHFISSRFVKEIARLGGDIASFVTPKVAKQLKKYYKIKA